MQQHVTALQMIAPKLVAEDSANNFVQSSGSEDSSPAESRSVTPTAAEAALQPGPFLKINVPESSHETVEPADQPIQQSQQEPEPQPLPAPHPPRVRCAMLSACFAR